jgi:hypothetical protein
MRGVICKFMSVCVPIMHRFGGAKFVAILAFLFCEDCEHPVGRPCARLLLYQNGITPPHDLFPDGKIHHED